jgi:RNA polymerase sigma-70 factor (ECF subfamily)
VTKGRLHAEAEPLGAAAPEPDGDVVERAVNGEEAAFRLLYDRHRPAVFRLARGFASLGTDDVEDVVQETFVRAFRALGRLERRERFAAWVLAIARNRALTKVVRARAAADLAAGLEREAESLAAADEGPELDEGAEAEVVRRIIAELPPGPEKETVHLFYVEGRLSAREIAERLGVGKSAITMRLDRFRAKVKRRLLAEVARMRGRGS